MLSTSSIATTTLRAYEETLYHAHADPAFTLHIGEQSPELLALHQRHGSECSAFLTAWNPFSQPTDDISNAARQTALADELTRRGLFFLHGIGQHPSNDWPGEASVLIVGLTREAAEQLGRELEQNALVWAGADAVPRLVLLR